MKKAVASVALLNLIIAAGVVASDSRDIDHHWSLDQLAVQLANSSSIPPEWQTDLQSLAHNPNFDWSDLTNFLRDHRSDVHLPDLLSWIHDNSRSLLADEFHFGHGEGDAGNANASEGGRVSIVPEPSSLLLIAGGIVLVGARAFRRR